MKSRKATDRTKSLVNYLSTKNEYYGSNDNCSVRQLKILDRLDIDRQILFKEKIDVLLEEKVDLVDQKAILGKVSRSESEKKFQRRISVRSQKLD